MAKYTLAGIVAVIMTAAAGLYLLSQVNKRDAAAGPAPVQTISIRHEGIFPRQFEVQRGQPIEIRLENRVNRYHLLDIYSEDVEQLVPVERAYVPDDGEALSQMHLEARAGETHSTVLRFSKSGEYEMRLTAAGLKELELIKVLVR